MRLPTWERSLMTVSWLSVKFMFTMSPVRAGRDAGNRQESSFLEIFVRAHSKSEVIAISESLMS